MSGCSTHHFWKLDRVGPAMTPHPVVCTDPDEWMGWRVRTDFDPADWTSLRDFWQQQDRFVCATRVDGECVLHTEFSGVWSPAKGPEPLLWTTRLWRLPIQPQLPPIVMAFYPDRAEAEHGHNQLVFMLLSGVKFPEENHP